ncbi:MAG: cell division protein [Archaeoglobi archaeon]|jgi:cell division GTPase FtsZ|nr:cell division protein [Archaeoglobi archaeon]TDA27338.1 MAG: cell division protein [Archaeoglobi archaeon]
MRLLTVGIGLRGAKIAELFYKHGVRVNRSPLFKCFAILSDELQIRSVSIDDDRKYYVGDRRGIPGFINALTRHYEIWEGNLVITSLEDDFAFDVSVEFCERLKAFSEDPIIYLTLIPSLGAVDVSEIKKKMRKIQKVSDIILVFEGKADSDAKIFDAMNMLALAGEVDIKKRVAGEVVVDTSDIFNALKSDGFSVVGFAEQKVSFDFFKKASELKAVRTRRILEMLDQAMNNLSINTELEKAKSALLLFCGPKEEVTMEGIFEAISRVEKLNKDIIIRYGDCPIPPALLTKKIAVVVLFSGLKSFKF